MKFDMIYDTSTRYMTYIILYTDGCSATELPFVRLFFFATQKEAEGHSATELLLFSLFFFATQKEAEGHSATELAGRCVFRG